MWKVILFSVALSSLHLTSSSQGKHVRDLLSHFSSNILYTEFEFIDAHAYIILYISNCILYYMYFCHCFQTQMRNICHVYTYDNMQEMEKWQKE